MFIESIEVKDFRNIEETAATFEPLTIIMGENHQGKTTVAQAIQVALTSRAEGTDAQGRGANDKIRSGAKKASIAMSLRGKTGVMPFAVTYGPGRTGRQIVSENPQPFHNWLAANSERLCCALDSDYFVRQKPEDQKSILASLVLPTTYSFPEDKRNLAHKYLNIGGFDWNANPIHIIDTIYTLAYTARRDANAALKAIHIPELPPAPTRTAEEVNVELSKLRAKAASLAKPTTSGTVELGRLQEQVHQIEERIKDLERDAEDLRSAITDVEGDMLSPATLKGQQTIAARRRAYDILEEEVAEHASQVEAQNNVEAIYREILAEKTCPTCRQSVNEAFIDTRIAEAKAAAAAAGKKQVEAMRLQKEMGDIAEAERMIAAHEEAAKKKSGFQRELADTVSKIASAQEKQRTLKSQLADLQSKPAAAPVETSELDAVNQQIATVESELGPALRYETIVSESRESVTRQKAMEAKIADLEILVEYFGKDGVKASLIQQHIEDFTASVNNVLKVWGYAANLSIEPYNFEVTNDKGKTLPLKELSGSEKLMFGVALQTAIAHHAKIEVVLVDKADTFLGAERNRLFSCLNSLLTDGTLKQAIVILADNREAVPQRAGVAYFAARDGKLVKL